MTDPNSPAAKRLKTLYEAPDGWRAHPIHTNYYFCDTMHPSGAAFNIRTGKFIRGTISTAGYRSVALYADGVKSSDSHHRLIYETFKAPIPAHLSIDHIDRDPLNNSLLNLRLATSRQQRKNQVRQPCRASWIPIIATNLEAVYRFENVQMAADALQHDVWSIMYCIEWNCASTRGYSFTIDTLPLAVDELAIEVSPTRRVTSFGRVQRLRGAHWVDQTIIPNSAGYMSIMYQGKQQCLHIVIDHLFNGTPADRKRGHVDHKNGDKLNNRAENLQWLTHGDHMRKTHNKACIIHGVRYTSGTEAARLLHVSEATVCRRLRQKIAGYEYA